MSPRRQISLQRLMLIIAFGAISRSARTDPVHDAPLDVGGAAVGAAEIAWRMAEASGDTPRGIPTARVVAGKLGVAASYASAGLRLWAAHEEYVRHGLNPRTIELLARATIDVGGARIPLLGWFVNEAVDYLAMLRTLLLADDELVGTADAEVAVTRQLHTQSELMRYEHEFATRQRAEREAQRQAQIIAQRGLARIVSAAAVEAICRGRLDGWASYATGPLAAATITPHAQQWLSAVAEYCDWHGGFDRIDLDMPSMRAGTLPTVEMSGVLRLGDDVAVRVSIATEHVEQAEGEPYYGWRLASLPVFEWPQGGEAGDSRNNAAIPLLTGTAYVTTAGGQTQGQYEAAMEGVLTPWRGGYSRVAQLVPCAAGGSYTGVRVSLRLDNRLETYDLTLTAMLGQVILEDGKKGTLWITPKAQPRTLRAGENEVIIELQDSVPFSGRSCPIDPQWLEPGQSSTCGFVLIIVIHPQRQAAVQWRRQGETGPADWFDGVRLLEGDVELLQ